jgi:hypothetical protein
MTLIVYLYGKGKGKVVSVLNLLSTTAMETYSGGTETQIMFNAEEIVHASSVIWPYKSVDIHTEN